MTSDGSGFGLPQMSEREIFDRLLSEDSERGDSEPAIAAGIGEQMLHMSPVSYTHLTLPTKA